MPLVKPYAPGVAEKDCFPPLLSCVPDAPPWLNNLYPLVQSSLELGVNAAAAPTPLGH